MNLTTREEKARGVGQRIGEKPRDMIFCIVLAGTFRCNENRYDVVRWA